MTRTFLGVLLLGAAAAAQAQVEARGAWVRGTVQGQTATGAFMELNSANGASLVGAESPAAARVEIHEMKIEGSVMKMRAVPRLELPPGRIVELKPGGYHLMLFGLKRPLKEGDVVPVRLKVQSSAEPVRTVEVRAEVRDFAATGQHGR